MGFVNSLKNLNNWFSDKTGITESKKSTKHKDNDCEIINNKKGCTGNNHEEVVVISDDSLSEVEKVDITEPGPSTMQLKASPPVMLIDEKCCRRKTMWPSIYKMDLTENIDYENRIQIIESCSLSYQPFLSMHVVGNANSKSSLVDKYSPSKSIKGPRKSNSSMESNFTALQINDTTSHDTKDKSLNMILRYYVNPKSETTGLSKSIPRSPLSSNKDLILNQSNVSQSSGKENLEILELSIHKNRIIKEDMFNERIIRKFKERKVAIKLPCPIKKQISQEDILLEKIDILKKELEKIEPPKKTDIFPGYNKEIQDSIIQLMSGPQNEYIIEGKNIKKSDIKTVYSPNGWLNDEVISHYLNMIVERDPISLHTFDTFFYYKLSTQGYQSVRRWSRKKDIFACRKMFTPIHLGNHWCLICVNFIDKNVKYYDSLGGRNPKCLNIIFNYLKEEYKNKKNKEFDCSGWQLLDADDCPAQGNGYDCGVFTCINAEYLARDAKLDFTQDDMPIFRNRICYEILINSLCY